MLTAKDGITWRRRHTGKRGPRGDVANLHNARRVAIDDVCFYDTVDSLSDIECKMLNHIR